MSRSSLLRLFALTSITFATTVAVSGCGSASAPPTGTPTLRGNWQFVQAGSALRLNAGFSSSADGTVSGVAHLSGTSCANAATSIVLTGGVKQDGSLRLISASFGGTTLTLTGQLAADGEQITNVSYAFSGESCASLATGAIFAAQYAAISGNYAGTFANTEGNQIAVTATLTQTTQPDANGQFHLAGSASFANSACFASPVITDSLVTGSSLSTTYSSSTNGQTATITASGTFNADASQLTISNWQVTGGLCDGETGTGSLAKQ